MHVADITINYAQYISLADATFDIFETLVHFVGIIALVASMECGSTRGVMSYWNIL